ncbi:MAG: phosphatase PAP2 family protein [Erysipelotrichaceae bacterium]|nr:phosphatase PAP2 family protein [Erysipelotrichaceae bacterium]
MITRKHIIGIISFLLILIGIGTVYDLQISECIYNPNLFGILFAGFGEAPVYVCLCVSGWLIVRNSGSSELFYKFIGWSCFLAVVLGTANTVQTVFPQKRWLITIAIFIYGLVTCFLVRFTKNMNVKGKRCVAQYILTSVLFGVVLVHGIKLFWGRPRFRLLQNQAEISYLPWWKPNFLFRDSAKQFQIVSEEFKSFPSGHTAHATTILALIKIVNCKKNRKITPALFAGYLYIAVIAYSRILMGAHFLSDVCFGFLIQYTGIIVSDRLFQRLSQKMCE